MKDPSEYSNLGEDFVLDEQERQTQLSNEQIEEIQQRLEKPLKRSLRRLSNNPHKLLRQRNLHQLKLSLSLRASNQEKNLLNFLISQGLPILVNLLVKLVSRYKNVLVHQDKVSSTLLLMVSISCCKRQDSRFLKPPNMKTR
jgi:hypothetical protein